VRLIIDFPFPFLEDLSALRDLLRLLLAELFLLEDIVGS